VGSLARNITRKRHRKDVKQSKKIVNAVCDAIIAADPRKTLYIVAGQRNIRNGIVTYANVGMTSRPVEERLKDYDYRRKQLAGNLVILGRYDISGYTDHQIHALLRRKFVMNPSDNANEEEFEFNCSIDEVCDEVFIAVNEVILGVSRPDNYKMREEQQECCDKAVEYFNNGGKRFLINAKMRFGKTFTAYQIIKGLAEYKMKVLVLTYKPSVRDEWQKPIDNHVDFKDFSHYYAGDFDGKNPVKLPGTSPVEVLFASFQDLNKFGKAKWKEALGYHWDILVIDEEHYGSSTERAKKTLGKLSYNKEVRLSGTPFKTLLENDFDDNEMFTWTYQDEQKKKKEDIKISGDKSVYRWLPQMKFHTFDVHDDVKKHVLSAGYADDEGFTMTKMWATENGKFIYPESVREFLNQLKGVGHKLSPYRVKGLEPINHTLWKLPNSIESVNALGKELKRHPRFEDYGIINVAGDNTNDLSKVKKAMRQHDRTITLSCGRFTTGVTIPEWNAVFMLDEGKSPESYFQTIFRCQSSNEKAKKECCYIFDFNPERLLEKVYEYCEVTSPKENIEESVREFLDYAPVLEYGENEMILISAERVLNQIAISGDYIEKFGSAANINVDKLNDNIIQSLKSLSRSEAKKLEISIASNGLTKGKNFVTNNKLTSKEKRENRKKTKEALEKAQTLLRKLPNYLLFERCEQKTVHEIIDAGLESFNDVTGVSTSGFGHMIKEGFLNERRINRNINSFIQVYKGI